MKIDPIIVYEDSCIIALNKPALIHSVSLRESAESVAAWLSGHYPELTTASDNEFDSGLINRLDYETSGVLVAAKTRVHWLNLREQFERGTIIKRYRAIIEGALDSGKTVEGYIGNRYRGSKKVQFTAHQVKRSLLTRSRLSRSLEVSEDRARSLITIEAETGARHQVRAHCASTGHPLAGDVLYGGSVFHQEKVLPPFVLHAASVSIRHPESGTTFELSAADPAYFQRLL